MAIKRNDDDLREIDRNNKEKIKIYADNRSKVKACSLKVGDSVIVKKPRKSKSDPHYDPVPYKVTKRRGNMIVAKRGNDTITRNSAFFKLVKTDRNDVDDQGTDDDDDFEITNFGTNTNNHQDETPDDDVSSNTPPTLRRSTRVTAEPVRYPMDVRT